MRCAAAGCLLALALAWSAAAPAQERWEELGPRRVGTPAEQLEALQGARCTGDGPQRTCLLAGGVFLGVPVRGVEALLRDGSLAQVVVRFDSTHYAALLEALRARLGEPEDRSYRARAGMAGEFEAGVGLWEQGTAGVILEEYAGKIDRGALTFGDAQAMRAALARERAFPPGARRDL